MLKGRDYKDKDLKEIEMNQYGSFGVITSVFDLFDGLKAETVIDDDNYIHAILFMGKSKYNGKIFVFAVYSCKCSKMIVRYVRKKLRDLHKAGIPFLAVNSDARLKKFHDVLFKEYL